jgi:paraquat-inducible protein A
MISSAVFLNTGKRKGFIVCHHCDSLQKVQDVAVCQCCGAELHLRFRQSLSRSWTLLLCALIFYIPANMLPIMTIEKLGKSQSDTIMSGVISLSQSGLWGIALVVFVASIVVPLLKMIGMAVLLLAVQFRWQLNPQWQTKIYRLIVFVGRWSMLDIFVVGLLAGLVEFDKLAMVTAESGATFFAVVVVLTLLSVNAFDPRLIWDADRRQ